MVPFFTLCRIVNTLGHRAYVIVVYPGSWVPQQRTLLRTWMGEKPEKALGFGWFGPNEEEAVQELRQIYFLSFQPHDMITEH